MTLREVAEYLKLSEKTVSRMAQEGRIPAQKLARQWRFQRDLVNHGWPTPTASPSTSSSCRPKSTGLRQPLTVANVITPARISLSLTAPDKNGVLRELCALVRDDADRPEGDRARRRRRQRRDRPCRPDHRRAGARDQAFRERFARNTTTSPTTTASKAISPSRWSRRRPRRWASSTPRALADALHGLTIKAADDPGILMDVTFDENGDIDREGFLVEVVDGKQVVKQVLPKLH